MLGLIYKDLISQRIISFAASAVVVVMGFMSIMCAQEEEIAFMSFGMLVMMYTGGAMLPETAMQTDILIKWNVYAMTLPTAAKKTVLAKYLLMLAMYLFCFIVTVIVSLISSAIYEHYTFSLPALLTLFGFITAFDSITYALIFAYGPKRGSTLKAFLLAAVPLGFAMYFLFGDLTVFGEDGIGSFFEWLATFDLQGFIGKAYGWVLLAALVSFVGGAAISGKVYRKGLEKGEC